MRKRSELLFNLLLVPLDGLTLLSSYIAAYLIRVDFTPLPTAYQISGSEYLAALIAWAPLNLFIFAATGLYLLDTSRSRLMEYGRVMVATSASAMALIIVDFFTTKPLFPSKSVVIYGLAISTVLIITMRFILSVIKRWLYRFNIGRRHVVVIGKG
ncbi:hypothetical protein KBC99_01430, partial [Candidatus Saccharibacteria bacterium]|nr:hypothetical protein [Candidatus Saccharibacteria bacterium]